jgi:hypothetical protein
VKSLWRFLLSLWSALLTYWRERKQERQEAQDEITEEAQAEIDRVDSETADERVNHCADLGLIVPAKNSSRAGEDRK